MNINNEARTKQFINSKYNTDPNNIIFAAEVNDSKYGFVSKQKTNQPGRPDFICDNNPNFVIIVECKANDHEAAKTDIKHYCSINEIAKDIIGMAVSGQNNNKLKVTYYVYINGINGKKGKELNEPKDRLLTLDEINTLYSKEKYPQINDNLISTLKDLNEQFHKENIPNRSIFFSGIMIALTNENFKNIYNNCRAPNGEDKNNPTNLMNLIIGSISQQLTDKINNNSKEISWEYEFAFIRNITCPLDKLKEIIKKIEDNVYGPFCQNKNLDILGNAYKIFLLRAGGAEDKSIILTPDHIKELMVELAELEKDDIVLDTCTGSGGFLMEAMKKMIEKANGDSQKIKEIKESQLIGFENNLTLFTLAFSNMFLRGDGKSQLIYYDSTDNESPKGKEIYKEIKNKKPTRVIINPPYEDNKSILFTERALDLLSDRGKLIIIMPTPTLTKNKDRTAEILKNAKFDFQIKMPFNLFSEQNRTVNTSIFGFTKISGSGHRQISEVLFYTLEDDGYVSIQHKGRVEGEVKWEDIKKKILTSIMNSKNEGVCQQRRIYNEQGDLNCAGWPAVKNNSDLVKIDKIFNIDKGTLASTKNIEGKYPFITGGKEWKTHNEYERDEEAIIYTVSAGGSLGNSHYIKGKFTASNLCIILTLKKDQEKNINLEFYNCYFQAIKKQIVSDLADGTSKLTIGIEAFKNYYIKLFPKKEQDKFVEENVRTITKAQSEYKKAKDKYEEALNKLK